MASLLFTYSSGYSSLLHSKSSGSFTCSFSSQNWLILENVHITVFIFSSNVINVHVDICSRVSEFGDIRSRFILEQSIPSVYFHTEDVAELGALSSRKISVALSTKTFSGLYRRISLFGSIIIGCFLLPCSVLMNDKLSDWFVTFFFTKCLYVSDVE